ncbi:unnamed protein product [Pleuronectes platessa]|uniref:Uncharacterized protein n=1 Tax=Pleuronectes platessa TaxID=8262 RepID=A0A9N7W4A5_PLEPL|nr:unnamed protein product [Pleuronectes platessa]
MQFGAPHRNISGRALFPEKQLLFGYGGNEMEAGVGGCGGCTLKETASRSHVQTPACDISPTMAAGKSIFGRLNGRKWAPSRPRREQSLRKSSPALLKVQIRT